MIEKEHRLDPLNLTGSTGFFTVKPTPDIYTALSRIEFLAQRVERLEQELNLLRNLTGLPNFKD